MMIWEIKYGICNAIKKYHSENLILRIVFNKYGRDLGLNGVNRITVGKPHSNPALNQSNVDIGSHGPQLLWPATGPIRRRRARRRRLVLGPFHAGGHAPAQYRGTLLLSSSLGASHGGFQKEAFL